MNWEFGGGHARGGTHVAGLPFGGIPGEMLDDVSRLVADEPDRDEPDIEFTHRPGGPGRTRLSLRRLVFAQWRLGAGAVLLVAVVSMVGQAGPMLINVAIDKGMLGDRSMSVVALMSALYLASVVLTSVAQYAQTKATGRLAASVMHDIRVRVFTHLQRLGLDFYTDEKGGVVMTRMTSDIENLQQLLQDGLVQIAVQALTMCVIAGLLLSMNVTLAVLTIALTVAPLLLLSVWFRSRSQQAYERVRDWIARVLTDLSESLHGIRVVALHNRQHHNALHHRNVVGSYAEANVYTAKVGAIYGAGTQMLGYLSQAVLLVIGGHLVLRQQLTVGELVAFFLYMNRFFAPIQLLVQQYNTYQQSQASMKKLRTLLDRTPNVEERAHAVTLPPVDGLIEFARVTFGYNPDAPVLVEASLVIEPGETVAFVGPTGAGKSTVAKLIARFYDPDQGAVRIDGHDLRDVTLQSLRGQLGMVPQEPFLFAGTLRDNIAFGSPGATAAEVERAALAVGLEDVIARLPDGLDSLVHERGQSLSSGERQLIALARTLLSRPRVLVLDEATSNLDLQSERRIESALEMVLEGRTAILIAHRLTTAMKADRIVVIDSGRIVETGSHDDLVASSGRYAAMFATWQLHADDAMASSGLVESGA
jgi:ATP-binding cassette subfamily B protein